MTQTRHMLLAWSLLGSIVAAFAAGVWLPTTETLARNKARIADQHARLAKMTSLTATRQDLQAGIEAMRNDAHAPDSSRYFTAKSPALGVAELQRHVLSVISQNAGHQLSSESKIDTTDADFHKLTVAVNLAANLATLQRILYDFEHGEPQIFVEQLTVSAHAANRRQTRAAATHASRAASTAAATGLSAQLLLAGYMHANETDDAGETTR